MKLLNLLVICFTVILFSFQNKSNDYSKILPGVTKVTDYLYYDQTEITNTNWLEYLNYMSKTYSGRSSAEYQNALPDTTVWEQALSYNLPYMKYYLRHAAYGGYPVVGVSWQQATDYCAWRTKRVKEYLEANGKLEKAPKIFTYRLPMFEEWKMMYAEVERLPFLIGDEGRRSYKGMARFNMKREAGDMATQAGQLNDNADVTAPAKSYWPNQYGVYNIKGNVSEWLLEKDTHIGGAWNVKTDADVSVKQALQTSSATVGFRCVCEVVDDAA